MQPWELSKEEWNRQREECKPQGQFKRSHSDKSEAVSRIEKLQWLINGIISEYPVTWEDVVAKAFEDGKFVICPKLIDGCLIKVSTPLPEGWVWDDGEEKYYAWCPECVKAWGW